MKFSRALYLLFSLFFGTFLSAQTTSHAVRGTVLDSVTGKPVEFAIVVLTSSDSTGITGMTTDSTGHIDVRTAKSGAHTLRLSMTGYAVTDIPLNIAANDSVTDLGHLLLPPDSKVLATAVFTSDKSDYSTDADKKVYEVGKNLTVTGGTATDVLQNIPSVTVDQDGQISLHGSQNVTILIDGKPSGISGSDRQSALSQVPAGIIERIEVITNPSSKYDAEGMGGIINIVTKKGSGKGWNGSASAGAGTHNKYTGALSIGHRGDKLNLYASYNYRYEDRWSGNGGSQHNFPADTSYYYQTAGGGKSTNIFHTGKIGADYYINDHQLLNLTAGYSLQYQDKMDSTIYDFLDEQMERVNGFQRNTTSHEKTQTMEGSAGYRYTSPDSRNSVSFLGSYSGNRKDQHGTYQNDFYGFYNPPYQIYAGTTDFSTSIAQLDITHHINDSAHWETGLKYSLRNNNNVQHGDLFDYNAGSYYFDQRFSDHFVFDEAVYAAYVQFGDQVKRISWQSGLRYEYTDLTGASGTTGLSFHNPYAGLFPSAAIVFDQKPGVQFRLSYGRRLNRPNNQQINPFIDYSDSIFIRTGNPYLQPEYIHSFEGEFSRTWESLSLDITGYYRHSNDMITFSRIYDINTGVGITMPRNFSTSDNIGCDAVIRIPFGKKVNAMISGSAYRSQINGDNIEAGLQTAYFGYNGKISVTWKITPQIAAQVNGNYTSPWKQPLGYFQMGSGMDAGARWEFLNKKASLTVNVTDIFDTKKFHFNSHDDTYEFNGWRQRESRVGMLTFSWIIGADDSKSKKGILQDDNSGGGGD